MSDIIFNILLFGCTCLVFMAPRSFLQTLTVFEKMQYLKASFAFSSHLVTKFRMFFGTMAFHINIISSYHILCSHTASHSIYIAGNSLHVCSGSGLYSFIT